MKTETNQRPPKNPAWKPIKRVLDTLPIYDSNYAKHILIKVHHFDETLVKSMRIKISKYFSEKRKENNSNRNNRPNMMIFRKPYYSSKSELRFRELQRNL